MKKNDIMARIAGLQDLTNFRNLHWEGSFAEYLEIVREDPRVARTAYQRLYDMIISYGSEEYSRNREKLVHYHFFDDPFENGKDAVFGIDKQLMDLVQIFRSAAHRYGTERRVVLLHGPVGTAKSTIVRLLKKGLEHYTRLDDGRLYSFRWEPTDGEVMDCPMHEDPLHLIPPQFRSVVLDELNDDRSGMERIIIEGDLCPACRFIFNELLEKADGDWTAVINQVKVKRILLSEKDRVGIGTFQPKDEKNQDSTELTGDINYRKIAEYGSDSDPRAFNFDGELNIANRGMVEFIEILKLDVAFLYDLLTASQEHKIKPKKFAHTDIDEVILGHTNEAEYRRLLNNEYMEALRDRTIKIDIPYNIRFQDEVKIYLRDFSQEKVIGKHIAPHTLQLAAFWAILTRLEEPKRAGISLVQKLRLYDGRSLPGFTEDTVIELQEESAHEGMFGISPRYIQDKISNALVGDTSRSCLNPFMIMRELESGLRHHSLITSKDQRKHFRDLLSVVRAEYDEIVKNEVQRAITADEEAIKRLSANYIDNVKAYTQKQKVRNPYTGQDEPPDERLMRAIEEKIEIPESRKDDFRREIMNYIGALAIDGKQFTWDANERLRRALELKLFEDQKDSIKLTSLVSNVIDQETQEKIEVVKSRMIKNMGYCEICATDVLNYVASIFARGDTQQRS
ncbi:MAG TPA: serine protein kinase [Chloroflexota bacterium]|nr:serine protein kinase [Chloroflexota bacterium]HUM68966.1 serine protein kinase [Chloroflexota bacterium]